MRNEELKNLTDAGSTDMSNVNVANSYGEERSIEHFRKWNAIQRRSRKLLYNMICKKSHYILLFVCLFVGLDKFDLSAQQQLVFFRNTESLKPFLAEIRSPIIKSEVGFINKLDGNYFVQKFTHRPFVESNIGFLLPLLNYKDKSSGLKIVSSAVIGNNVLVDLFGPPTAAVINTDYFYGFRTGAVKYTNHDIARNYGLIFIPIMHESAHLGDEFSLHGYQLVDGFKRINLSYETWEIVAVINDPDTIKSNLLSFKIGIQGLWKPSEGYYFADSLEVQGAYVPNSNDMFEFFAHLNIQRTEGVLCSKKWMQVFSMEIRNRTKLSYDVNIPEVRTWNYNIYLGWIYQSNRNGKNAGIFLRYYNGIIPHGQLRNTGGFQFLGISMVFY